MFGKKLSLKPDFDFEKRLRSQMESKKENCICLCENSATEYSIIVAKNTAQETLSCAEEMQKILKKMTGCLFPIKNDSCAPQKCEIVIGNTNRGIKESAGENGFVITCDGERVLLYGYDEITTVYAVYTFLEEHLGCMWITSEEDFIPNLPTIRIAPVNKAYIPSMKWRCIYSYETIFTPWYKKLRLNGIGDVNGKRTETLGWGTWCHTEWKYVPPNEFYKDHPEYYAKKGDKIGHIRPGHEALLCLSNPEVYNIVRDRLAKDIAEHPECKYWDFSVMDSWSRQKGCTCKKCREANEREGSGMGTMLPFINKLAREFPDKIISTLAYHYTIKPPKTLKAEKNVAIKLCAMPGSQAATYLNGGTKGADEFKKYVEEWKNVCDNIIIWDYVVNFKHLILPFPNFSVQQDNQKFYEQNNVSGIFHQGSREKSDEMADMRAYLLAKLMWNGSSFDTENFLNRYIAACYGKAGKYIAEYMMKCSDALYSSQKELGIYDFPIFHSMDYLSKKHIKEYLICFEKAEKEAENKTILNRIKKLKMPVLYAKMLECSRDLKGKEKAADEFFETARKCGFDQLSEWGLKLDEFERYYYYRLSLSKYIPFYRITNFKFKVK